ncbi:cyclase family protein [Candidatus Protochlamydia amoebophila]|uniref:N-acetyltransferase domain-containing protein n=1 Tax=Protochlamydia amoebophila (strain UWE25) TaxID=264201 RepID=Q6MCZ0_PARUW|nr:cyclase family protein [Candidatus Protochlamydia amoebophila]CAF23559.1 unnamed protein product [Candidatus Protochlamydia amoebophila UWE25]
MKNSKTLITLLSSFEAKQAYHEMLGFLPELFGNSKTEEKEQSVTKEKCFFGYFIDRICLGILALEFPFVQTAHIDWIRVKENSPTQEIEKALLCHAEMFCQEHSIYSLTAETRIPLKNEHLKGFEFYIKAGFRPLFERRNADLGYVIVYLNKIISPKIFKWVDLTHELSEKIPTWDRNCGFKHKEISTYEEGTTDCQFSIQSIEMLAGAGTHIDAPAHCYPHSKTVIDLPLQSLISPCVVIDVSEEAHDRYSVDILTIRNFERKYGNICKNTFVIFYTGWERFWKQPEKYHNHFDFPSVTQEVAEYLVSKDIRGIGIDTLSPDRPDSKFPVHQIILGAGKYIVENVAKANLLPAVGSYVFVMPIPIVKGTEAPIRLLGMFPG